MKELILEIALSSERRLLIFMYDINKRKELKNAKVKDILEILKELPEDADVYFNGDNYGYIRIEKDSSAVCFDDKIYELRKELGFI